MADDKSIKESMLPYLEAIIGVRAGTISFYEAAYKATMAPGSSASGDDKAKALEALATACVNFNQAIVERLKADKPLVPPPNPAVLPKDLTKPRPTRAKKTNKGE